MPRKIFVLGIDGSGRVGVGVDKLRELLSNSEVVFGSSRQVSLLKSDVSLEIPTVLSWSAGIDQLKENITERSGNVLALASGDPGYFGIVRLLKSTFPLFKLEIYPVPSAVSLAFAKAETNWEDAVVISAHGRSYQRVLSELLRTLQPGQHINKLAVLCSPEHTPEFIAQLLTDAGAKFERYLVCSNLGSEAEAVVEAPLSVISASQFEPLSILLALRSEPTSEASVSNLRPSDKDNEFFHQGSMITKPEVRDVIFSKLAPYLSSERACLWDLGAGSGSVGITVIRRIPSIRLFLVERDPIQIRLIGLNSSRYPEITVVSGRSEDAIWDLPDPDAVFVGGGGIPVLKALGERLAKPTFVLASFAAINRVSQAADLLGNMMEILLPVGIRLPDGSWRLEGENPVFISWGLLG